KALGPRGRVREVSAMEENLAQNMKTVIEELEASATKPGVPPQLAEDVLPRLKAAHKEVEQEIASVLAKDPNPHLYAPERQRTMTGSRDSRGIDRVVPLAGASPTAKVTSALLDRLATKP